VFKPSQQIVTDAVRNNTLYDGSAADPYVISRAVSGTFGVDVTMNGSVHLATGDLTIAAAPGGNRAAQKWDGTAENATHQAMWTSEFSCASCHAPHGSYSYRLMHYSPNRISSRLPEDGGLRVSNLVAALATDDADGYWYAFPEGTTVFIKANAFKGPWVYGYVSRTDQASYYIYIGPNADRLTANAQGSWSINFGAGKFKPAGTYVPPVGTIYVSVSPALKVVAPTILASNRISYGTGATTAALTTNGYAYNLFCAGCHTDYERSLTTATAYGSQPGDPTGTGAGNLTGIFSKAHRHTTWRGANGGMEVVAGGTGGTSNMMCVSCHFTHGSDSLIMKTADEVVIGAAADAIDAGTADAAFLAAIAIHESGAPATGDDYIAQNKDINVSSALKRYTNMAVCWKCHTSSHAEFLKNNPYVYEKYTDITTQWHTYGATGQYGGASW
jgi:hypothetical protein